MAEAFAILGGSAAVTQLVHYGFVLLSTTSALSRQIRHAPDRIQSWIDQCSTLLHMLDNIRNNITRYNLSTSHFVEQCRGDVVSIRALLRPFRNRLTSRRPSRVQEVLFVVRRETEVESRLESFRQAFNMLALNLIVLSQHQDERQMQPAAFMSTNQSLTSSRRIDNPNDLVVIAARSNEGIALFYEGRLSEAQRIQQYVYSKRRHILGERHQETIKSKANVAIILNEMGHHTQAAVLFREARAMFETVLGFEHPDTLKTCHNLATALHDKENYEEAEEAIMGALPTMQTIYGPGHEYVLEALEFHATILHYMQMYAAALDVIGKVYQQRLISDGYYHDDTQRVLSHLRDLAEDREEEQAMEGFFSRLITATT
ncbi:hypothetical protein CC86DRAFT_155066 [Ophiobolus disseminans]|uniref:TPR-like protein n=1 Tax=Ophiobolus disseminans TaxID=1469910 RepID=A0A6A6ZC06_9PLEO|nr:hypothetical protein CC86DRAFT_155066 [Ophiobolus disseminans]